MTGVVVVGDAVLDVHVTPLGQARPGGDVPATIRIGAGGQGANLAVRLARLGLDVTLVCALGDDVGGAVLRSALEADGVSLRPIGSPATGTVVILGGGDGERTMLSQRLSFAADVAAKLEGNPDWIVVSGYLLLEPGAGALARILADHGDRRVLVGCDVSQAQIAAWRTAAAALRPDLVVLNRDEALHGRIEDAFDGVVITDAEGAVASVGDARAEVRTPRGPRAVDTTGAGDAFAAALVAALADAGWPPTQPILAAALASGVRLAAAVARAPGAQARVEGEPRTGLPA